MTYPKPTVAEREFVQVCVSIREIADQIAILADDHLGVDYGDVHFGHVGDAKRLLSALRAAVEPLMPVDQS